jgi:hypothetical protein
MNIRSIKMELSTGNVTAIASQASKIITAAATRTEAIENMTQELSHITGFVCGEYCGNDIWLGNLNSDLFIIFHI